MGWAGLLGALGQGIGGQMMKDREQERELKIRQQLEEAQQKRQMFLERYRSDLSYTNQSQLAQEADARKIEAASNDFSHHIEATPSGVSVWSTANSKLVSSIHTACLCINVLSPPFFFRLRSNLGFGSKACIVQSSLSGNETLRQFLNSSIESPS